jgi:hypothetical protein
MFLSSQFVGKFFGWMYERKEDKKERTFIPFLNVQSLER